MPVTDLARAPRPVLRLGAVRIAKAKLDRAVQAQGLARQQIEKEVNNATLMLRAADSAVEASRAGLAQAEEEFRARFNAVAALADYDGALAMWLRATGRVR